MIKRIGGHPFTTWLVLVLMNFFVTFLAFNQIPSNIAYDEILLGKLALQLGKQPYTMFTSLADGHATPYFYVMLATFKLFGVNNFALRLPAALAGCISVFVFYAITKLLWKDKKAAGIPLPFIPTLLFTCMRWRITFIRFSFETSYLLLLELVATLWFFRYTESKKSWHLAVAGIFAGLAFHSYQPGRLFFVVPLILLILVKINWRHTAVYGATVALFVLPLIVILFQNPHLDGRIGQIGYLQNKRYSIVQKAQFASDNGLKTIQMFFTRGDANGRHNFPYKAALNPIFALFFLCGLFVAATHIGRTKNVHTLFFLLYGLAAVLPALLTLPSENPHMLRTYTAIPAVVYFTTVALKSVGKLKKNYVAVISVALLFIGCLYDLRTYFVFQSRVMRNSFEVVCPIEKVIYRNTKHIGDLPKECRVHKNMF